MLNGVLVVTISHFVLTSLFGHYIAVQIGTQMGQAIAGGLTSASAENNKDDATTIYQNMKNQSEAITDKWKFPELIISLPIVPVLKPALQELRQIRIKKVINKEISRDQFFTQGVVIDYTVRFLNSLSLGLLLYIALRIINRKITKGST